MARQHSARRKAGITVAAWACGLIIFFPILWMVLTSFKSEVDAFATPPKFLFFHWTTENYAAVEARSDYFHFAWNSILLSVGSTLVLSLILRSGISCGETKPPGTGRNRSGVSVWACARPSSNAISARHAKSAS